MREVSQEWIENQKRQFTSESHIRVTLSDSLLDFPRNGITGGDTQLSIAGAASWIVNNNSENSIADFGTLELNRWLLDGNVRTPSSVNRQNEAGMISNSFINTSLIANFVRDWRDLAPNLNSFQQMSDLRAITITFDSNQHEYATNFDIRIINQANNSFRTFSVRGNTQSTVVVPVNPTTNWNRLEIRIINWSTPNRRARIDNTTFGFKQMWSNKDIIKYNFRGENSPILAKRPSENITIEINDPLRLYDPLDHNSFIHMLLTEHSIKVDYGFEIDGQIEYIQGVLRNLYSWRYISSRNILRLEMRDHLQNINHLNIENIFNRVNIENDMNLIAQNLGISNRLSYVHVADDHKIVPERLEENDNALEVVESITQIMQGSIRFSSGNETLLVNDILADGESVEPGEEEVLKDAEVIDNTYKVVFASQFDSADRIISDTVANVFMRLRHPQNPASQTDIRAAMPRRERFTRRINGNVNSAHNFLDWIDEIETVVTLKKQASAEYEFTTIGTKLYNVRAWQYIDDTSSWHSVNVRSENLMNIELLENRRQMRVRVQVRMRRNRFAWLGGALPLRNLEVQFNLSVRFINDMQTINISSEGKNIFIDNRFTGGLSVSTPALQHIGDWLKRRQILQVDCRIDPRLELLDNIEIETEHGTRRMTVTQLEITYDGWYTGRIGGVLFDD